jgi:hypothetical protein
MQAAASDGDTLDPNWTMTTPVKGNRGDCDYGTGWCAAGSDLLNQSALGPWIVPLSGAVPRCGTSS